MKYTGKIYAKVGGRYLPAEFGNDERDMIVKIIGSCRGDDKHTADKIIEYLNKM